MSTRDFAVMKEIEAQIIQLDIKIKKEEKIEYASVTDYVKLLKEKRELQTLLNDVRNGRI